MAMLEGSGPAYPKLGSTVAKYRKLPRTPENIRAHAEALTEQVLSLQRSELSRATTPSQPKCPCASGTYHSDGKKIIAAIRSQHERDLAGALADSWRKRSDEQVRIAYEAAMAGRDAPLTHHIHTSTGRS